MEKINQQIDEIARKVQDFRELMGNFEKESENKLGATRLKLAAKLITESAKILETLVRANTFPNQG